jgi:preprotein translocase subunit SecE
VARDRKRAKRRRDRRGTTAGGRVDGARTAEPGVPVRADLPGSLDHAGAEVDEFDAALIRGAGGVTASPDAAQDAERGSAQADAGSELARPEAGADAGAGNGSGAGDATAIADGVGPDTLSEREIEREAVAEGDLSEDRSKELRARGAVATPEQASGARLRGPHRAIAFLQASWAELQRVQWPDRRQVFQATAVVLGFVAIAGAYLGLADIVAKEIVEFIL